MHARGLYLHPIYLRCRLALSSQKLLKALRTVNASLQPRDLLFGKQLDLIDDTSRFIIAKVARRGGKSFTFCIKALQLWYEDPTCTCLYGAPTADQAFSIMAPVYRKILRILQWDHLKVSDSAKSIIGPNGPIIVARGFKAASGESSEGGTHKLIVVDEAGIFKSSELRHVIMSSLRPMLIDNGGTLLLGGRPGSSGGYYQEAVNGLHGYSVHEWNALDNPHVAKNLQREMDELRTADPDVDNKAWFKRNYLNQFADDDDQNKIFYAFTDDCKVDAASGFIKYIGGLAFGPDLSIGLVVCGQQKDGMHVVVDAQSLSPSTPLPTIARLANDLVGRYKGLIFYGPHDRRATLHALVDAKCPVYSVHPMRTIDITQHLNTLFTNQKLQILFPDLEQLTEQLSALKWAEGHQGAKLDAQQPRNLVQALLFV